MKKKTTTERNKDENEKTVSGHLKRGVMDESFKLCKPPFFFRAGYIFDASGNMIADEPGVGALVRLRGWGRLGGMHGAEELQDAIGKHIARAMTEYWEKGRP